MLLRSHIPWCIFAVSAALPAVGGDGNLEDWEPDETVYFGTAIAEFSVHNLSATEFNERIRAGRPFVVRGAAEGHPMQAWDCNFFRNDVVFRDVEVKREYAQGTVPAKKFVPIQEIGVTTPKADGQGEIAPYYFAVKDAVDNSPEELAQDSEASATWTKKVLKKVQKATQVFPFMDQRNANIMRGTPEIWFSTATSSARAHVDSHTQSTVSMQLAGQKRWRLSLMGKRRHPHVMRLYADGQLYGRSDNASWQELDDVVLDAGDAVFFGPGFIHETKNLHAVDRPGLDTCAVSITYQFNIPEATGLFRDFAVRFRWTPDVQHAWHMIKQWLKQGKNLLAKQADGDDDVRVDGIPEGWSGDLAAFFDRDKDGVVTTKEINSVVSMWSETEKRVSKVVPKQLKSQGFGFSRAADHDALHEYPAALRKAIEEFEQRAFQADQHRGGKDEL